MSRKGYFCFSRRHAMHWIWSVPLAASLLACSSHPKKVWLPGLKPEIIAHRGASGYRPEHTLEAYQLAIDQGADWIEPDLVVSKDRVLIVRHENELSDTTDVADKFPQLKKVKYIDGVRTEGFFAEDLTLQQIKTLRVKERLSYRKHDWDGHFQIPTLKEVLDLAEAQSKKLTRVIGVYPETKHPSYFKSLHYELEPLLAKELKQRGLQHAQDPVIVQSAEMSSLERLRSLGLKNRMTFLLGDAKDRPYDFVIKNDIRKVEDLTQKAGLLWIRKTADGIGPNKKLIFPIGSEGNLEEATNLIDDAHDSGLYVHAYTFRAEPQFIPKEYEGDPKKELKVYFALGVDGIFTDFTDLAFSAREEALAKQ